MSGSDSEWQKTPDSCTLGHSIDAVNFLLHIPLSPVRWWRSAAVVALLLVAAEQAALSQNVTLSISPEIDSLNADLLKHPQDRSLQLRVIQAYTLSFNPELALLEILNTESQNKLGLSDAGIKGRVQMSLEQVDPALQSLETAYLQAPSDETLALIAVLEYAKGEEAMGHRLLERLKGRSTNLPIDLLRLYERFYLNGRKEIAGAILHALQETDPVAYRTFFPLPQLSLLSPADNFATEASQTSVIVEVHHTRPLRSVQIGDSLVFNRKEEKGESATENVSQTFSPLIPVHEGRNTIVVEVTDIFGNTGRDSVHVNGMSFGRLAGWSSPLEDSLRTKIEFLRNYVPDSVLVKGQSASARALIISAGSDAARDRGLFLHEYLTNPVSGFVPPANVKILIGERVRHQNIELVAADWLLKEATFQSMSIVYLSGRWSITRDDWYLFDGRGQPTNMKPILRELGSTAAAGAVVLIDGPIDQPGMLADGLRELTRDATIPFEAAVLGTAGSWPEHLMAAVLNRDSSSAASDSIGENLTVQELEQYCAGSEDFLRSDIHPVIARNPIGVIIRNHEQLFQALERKLSAEKVSQSARTKILRFSRDWRRYNEVRRYLSNQLSVADFVVRVDEYERRMGETP